MSEELMDFNNMLMLKNHLCSISESDLLKIYQDVGAYVSFLDAVALLGKNDSGFLLFSDSFISKILTVAQIHRFDLNDSDIKDAVNSIIDYLNQIKSYSQELKNSIKNGYLAYHEDLRECTFHSTEAFLQSLSYDAYVFRYLIEGRQDELTDETNLILSIHYLMATVPEFFQDPEINQRARDVLDRVGNNSPTFGARKKHVKKEKEGLLKLLPKEE
ncbi:MAG: hypothetical protein J6X28_02475 [Bacilli bacterium]|nr:hypothetical protein [Bacilli bacterium]